LAFYLHIFLIGKSAFSYYSGCFNKVVVPRSKVRRQIYEIASLRSHRSNVNSFMALTTDRLSTMVSPTSYQKGTKSDGCSDEMAEVLKNEPMVILTLRLRGNTYEK
jgi:hypothetical protein